MTDVFDLIKSLEPNLDKIFESPIEYKNQIVGWNSVCRLYNGYAYAGGTSLSRELARKKGLMEALERSLVQRRLVHQNRDEFALDTHPSTNGFACANSEKMALRNAIFEACERHLWSEWQDRKISLREIVDVNLSPLASCFKEQFDSVRFFEFTFKVDIFSEPLRMSAVVSVKGEGVFWGTRVDLIDADGFEHCLIEAYRNLKSYQAGPIGEQAHFEDLVLFKFGKNGRLSFSPLVHSIPDPVEDLKFSTLCSSKVADNIWIARALVVGFKEMQNQDLAKMIFW